MPRRAPNPPSDRPIERRPANPAEAFRPEVLRWWASARARRDRLPWRDREDPWEILVAEVMLAQTQTGRVAAIYPGFLERFPTPAVCAEAREGEVLRAWQGLGYNRRALALQASARLICERHGGAVPRTLEELLSLPGIGPYTARAVAAFAFAGRVGVLDTNIGRVLARAVAGEALTRTAAQSLADSLVPAGSAREWNLALMDLGALLCRATPICTNCPLPAADACAWRKTSGGADPATGSAGVSTAQARFSGSVRQVRGRIIRVACQGPIPRAELARCAGVDDEPDRALGIAAQLVTEGLLVEAEDGSFALP